MYLMNPMKSRPHFDPVLHTRDRLLRQIEAHSRHGPDSFLIGSLGRAAALRSEGEFRRGEKRRNKIAEDTRGILIYFCRAAAALSLPATPFPVDTTAVTAHDQRVVNENGDYWLVDELVGIALPVDAAVFEPQRGCLLGELDVFTVALQTHQALLFVIYEDPRNMHWHGACCNSESTHIGRPCLPDFTNRFGIFIACVSGVGGIKCDVHTADCYRWKYESSCIRACKNASRK